MQLMIKRSLLVPSLIILFLSFLLMNPPVFASSSSAEYLCEFGITFYKSGKYDDALTEFQKALLIDPSNSTARQYINKIFQDEMGVAKPKKSEPSQKQVATFKNNGREEAVNDALNKFTQTGQEALPPLDDNIEEQPREKPEKEEPNFRVGPIDITGEVQLRAGVDSGGRDHDPNFIWRRANWDLNEKNWRILSGDAFNRYENTYDPRIFDRLKVNLDTNNETGFGFHSNITMDPWTYVSKSDKITVTGENALTDYAQVELKYWSNTGYTINEKVLTLRNGDSLNLPELKVHDGRVAPFTVISDYGNVFNFPEIKIKNQEIQPVRELWFDYKQEGLKIKFFPSAYEKEALSFDDPLKISNNHLWWEDSPWLRKWAPGNLNPGALPAMDFTKGRWDNSLSFFARDSDGLRLTTLRGLSLEAGSPDDTSFSASFATPKDPWQDYTRADNIIGAARFKHQPLDNLDFGVSTTARMGFDNEQDNKTDARNFVGGVDLGYEIMNGLKTTVEVATSHSEYDLTSSEFKTKSNGFAYHFSIIGRFPFESVMNTKYGYAGIKPSEQDDFFTKFRFFAAHMDEGFDPTLSTYRETRDDEFWSRHLHFRQPFQYYDQESLTWDDVKGYAIGNGIDVGRNTIGVRVESTAWQNKLNNLFDLRNVHNTSGGYVETVVRDELTWELNRKLTTKLLLINQDMPQTSAGRDPYVFNPNTNQYYYNDWIEEGKDPSVRTGSLGAEYKFFDWLAINGIWEYTNDISLGYDNFPRGILNAGNQSWLTYEYDKAYRDTLNWLYDQQYFPTPPYPYYNIFKAGLRINPMENMEIYLDYTRNPYEKAGQVDDNMNHVGFEMAYKPVPKIDLFFKYNYSRWQDLDRLILGSTKLYGHHNLFAEFMYHQSQNEDFVLQYGEASRNPVNGTIENVGWDPYGGSLRTIDTRHIIRAYYRRKF